MPDTDTTGPRPTRPAPRPGPADPVKTLLHSHRELCARAVDPLEIAAGLEAHGVTDRAATRFRHRNVFSLAEELYARVPRPAATGRATETSRASAPRPARAADPRAVWAARGLLPGAVAVVGVLALSYGTDGAGEGIGLATGAAGALALGAALTVALRRGPLRVEDHTARVSRLWACWLLAYVLYGDGLTHLTGGAGGDGPRGTPSPAEAAAPLVALALGVVPALWCAHLLSVRARHALADSHGLADFAARVRPVLLGLLALHALALTALAVLAGLALGGSPGTGTAHPVATVALGSLLFLDRLLTVHGFPGRRPPA